MALTSLRSEVANPRPIRLPPATIRKLQRLLDRRHRLEADCTQAADELCLAVLHACEVEGATRNEVARALGVGTSTVQGWVKRGLQIAQREATAGEE